MVEKTDLVLLAADKNMEYLCKAGLRRPEALGIRPIRIEFRVHPARDGGVRTDSPRMLSLEQFRFRHALMVLDHEGSGTRYEAKDLERQLDEQLQRYWGDRAKAIVIEPELEAWVWASDNALRQILRWQSERPVRGWLREQGFTVDELGKLERPKEALAALVQAVRQPRSAALYSRIGERISLENCVDPAFNRLKQHLQKWFPHGP